MALALGAMGCLAADSHAQSNAGSIHFEQRIRPLLVKHCQPCHSASAAELQGGLLLDTKQGWEKGGAHGPAIVPGKPEASRLIDAVRGRNGAKTMPPGTELSEREIEALEEWIRQGAPDPRTGTAVASRGPIDIAKGRAWWAFQPLRKTGPPPLTENRPPLRRGDHRGGDSWSKTTAQWARTGVDRFILAKLRPLSIRPNPIADRRTLLRRATLDLTGLPPTLEEMDEFLADRSPNAWEKAIDRLLASARYGERYATHWLDLARFAESHGFEHDYDRPNAYFYRDFVIKALNADMPFDRFAQWQIAGDELAPEDPLAMMATGFLAAGVHSTQITLNQVEKERYDELDDMLSTTTTAFLGLTSGCARCHDHKFDPIPTADYYRMLSTFTKTVRSDFDVDVDPEGYRAAREKWDLEHAPLVSQLRSYEDRHIQPQVLRWLRSGDAASLAAAEWRIAETESVRSEGGAAFSPVGDGSFLASGANPDNDTIVLRGATRLGSVGAIRLEALADPSLPKGGPGRAPNGNFALTDIRVVAEPLSGGAGREIRLKSARASFEQRGLAVAGAIDADRNTGWAIDPRFGQDHAAVFVPAEPVALPGGCRLALTLKFENNKQHSIGRLRLSVSEAPGAAIGGVSRGDLAESGLIASKSGARPPTPEELEALAPLAGIEDAEWLRLRSAVQRHLQQAPKRDIRKVLISSEGVPAVRLHTQGGDFLEQTHFLKRGDPNQKGSVAKQSFLQVLITAPEAEAAWQKPAPPGWRTSHQRAAFARWLTDDRQGAGALLARVIVNRLWQRHLGRGIVGTPSDFGFLGERPTHPELLDWLAVELIRNGWRLKPLHKLIMTSAVYMQSAKPDPVREKADSANRLLWKRNRLRLEAEAIRDSILAVSGTLDPTMYGPGTLDPKMKRRSVYFTMKRSKLVPAIRLFDGPDANSGMPVRPTTTIAPQALHLMNSPEVREAAVAFAARIMQSVSETGERIRLAFRLALGRDAGQTERQLAARFIASQVSLRGRSEPANAEKLALADFCQSLFCLNEFAYVD